MAQIRYLTGASNAACEAVAFERNIGLMIQPGSSYHGRLSRYPFWAADNGAFTKQAAGFSAERFRTMLNRPELQEHAAHCLFVVAPDCLRVLPDGAVKGDALGTLQQFPAWAAEIRALGLPVALVAQNGLEDLLDQVPWDLLDVLFIGGDTAWKLSHAAERCAAEARARGKRTHMGRVNSFERLARASAMLVDTADGTFLRFGPDTNLPRLSRWFEKLGCGVQVGLFTGNKS